MSSAPIDSDFSADKATVSSPTSEVIGLIKSSYDAVVSCLGKKKRVLHQFHGDSYKTIIRRDEEGHLMGKDPEHAHERFIMLVDEQQLRGDYGDMKLTSFKAIAVKFFLQRDYDPDSVLRVVISFQDYFNGAESISDDTERQQAFFKWLGFVKAVLDAEKDATLKAGLPYPTKA